MAYFPPPPKIIIRPQMHVIRCDNASVNIDDAVIEIWGCPMLTERLWPNLTYPTYRDRPLEHGEILTLSLKFEGTRRRHALDATAVVDLWGDYREEYSRFHGDYWAAISGGHNDRVHRLRPDNDCWYVRSCEPGHEPRRNLVAMCPWKVQFRPPRRDDDWLGYDGDNAALALGRRVEEWHV